MKNFEVGDRVIYNGKISELVETGPIYECSRCIFYKSEDCVKLKLLINSCTQGSTNKMFIDIDKL